MKDEKPANEPDVDVAAKNETRVEPVEETLTKTKDERIIEEVETRYMSCINTTNIQELKIVNKNYSLRSQIFLPI